MGKNFLAAGPEAWTYWVSSAFLRAAKGRRSTLRRQRVQVGVLHSILWWPCGAHLTGERVRPGSSGAAARALKRLRCAHRSLGFWHVAEK